MKTDEFGQRNGAEFYRDQRRQRICRQYAELRRLAPFASRRATMQHVADCNGCTRENVYKILVRAGIYEPNKKHKQK